MIHSLDTKAANTTDTTAPSIPVTSTDKLTTNQGSRKINMKKDVVDYIIEHIYFYP